MSKSPNHYNGRNGWKPDMIVCHVAEGGFDGSVSWLCNPAAQSSSHFVIGEKGQVAQLVDLADGSWCNGTSTSSSSNTYYGKAANRLVRERATNANFYTYTIEHEGYSYKNRYGALTEQQYQATLGVIKQIITHMKSVYGITFTPDREHLIGHCDVAPVTKPNCPSPNKGGNYPFNRLISDIKAWMGVAPSSPAPAQPPVIQAPQTSIRVGDPVKLKPGAKTYTGSGIASFIYDNVYRVDDISGLRAVLDKNGICTPVNVNDLVVQTGALITAVSKPDAISTGSKVKVKPGAKSYEGKVISAFVYNGIYRVDDLKGDRALLDRQGICTPFNLNDLILQ